MLLLKKKKKKNCRVAQWPNGKDKKKYFCHEGGSATPKPADLGVDRTTPKGQTGKTKKKKNCFCLRGG